MDQFENAERQRRPTSTLGLADSVGRDLRYSFRRLLRRPTFTLAAVLTLALGIGANTAVFSVVNAVLLKPLSYPQSNELVSLQHVAPGNNSGTLGMSPDLYFTYRDENRAFEQMLWEEPARLPQYDFLEADADFVRELALRWPYGQR
jgi:hypothetical protein